MAPNPGILGSPRLVCSDFWSHDVGTRAEDCVQPLSNFKTAVVVREHIAAVVLDGVDHVGGDG